MARPLREKAENRREIFEIVAMHSRRRSCGEEMARFCGLADGFAGREGALPNKSLARPNLLGNRRFCPTGDGI